jgi:hypothetical protein
VLRDGQRSRHSPFDFVPREVKESTWTGVYWAGRSRDGSGGRWRVQCNNMYLGSFKYEDEHAAARCYNFEAIRIGLTTRNDVPDAPKLSKNDRFFKKGEYNQLYE